MIQKIVYINKEENEDTIPRRRHNKKEVETKKPLFNFNELEFDKFNVLIGKNGSGKSSIISGMYANFIHDDTGCAVTRKSVNGHFRTCGEHLSILYDEPTELALFTAREDNGKYRGYLDGDVTTDVACLFASEGQSNKISFGAFITKLGQKVRQNPDKHVTLLIDELESGLSPNVIREVMFALSFISGVEKNMQIILSTNNWESLNSLLKVKLGDSKFEYSIIDVSKGEQIQCPASYNDFYKLYE